MIRYYLSGFILLGLSLSVNAHKASDSYLYVNNQQAMLSAQWDIALRDLEYVIGLDNNANNEITWGEVKAHSQAINAYALSRLQMASDQLRCPATAGQHLISHHNEEAYLTLPLIFDCPTAVSTVTIEYELLFDKDASHRGLVRLDSTQNNAQTWVFNPSSQKQQIDINDPGPKRLFLTYLVEGAHHIWIGYDHLLFLITLLFPAVLVYRNRQWQAVSSFKPAFLEVVKIVTAFTLSHSITLTLAVLHIISFPARWVEVAIALSVFVAALNNLFPVVTQKRWVLAFSFGLLHGFGFANVLIELGLPTSALALALFGFNLGVELGQLLIVVGYFPFAYYFRNTQAYQWAILRFGSFITAIIAMVWMISRVMNYTYL